MPINFPNSPSPNQQYTYDNKTWEWNGTYWEVYSALTSYITSAYTVGDGYSDISGVTGGDIVLKSFSGVNINVIDGGDKLTFSGYPQQNVIGVYLPLSGGTLTGGTIFQSGLTANTISSTTVNTAQLNIPLFLTTAYFLGNGSPNSLALSGSSGIPSLYLGNVFTDYVYSDGISVTNNSNVYSGTFQGIVSNNRTYTLPDNSGTLALSVNGVTANSTGNISLTSFTGNTIFQSGLTATTISATTYQNLPFSGTVTGGGTTNYIPKFTGTTALGNSLIYDDGTNIGIGTVLPSARVDVSITGGTVGFRISGDSTSDMLRITQTGSGNAILVEDSSNPDSTPFVITSGGTVGVGTTSPLEKLHVSGNTIISGGLTASTISATSVTITPPTDTSSIVSTGYSVTGSGTTAMLRFNGSVNTSGNITPYIFDVTNTASGSGSFLAQFRRGGSYLWGIGLNDGLIYSTNHVSITGSWQIFARENAINGVGIRGSNPSTHTSGSRNHLFVQESFAPTAGTGTYTSILSNPTINQTGGSSGITRGLYVNPIITSAADWRAIETSIGNVMLNTVSGNTLIGTTTNSGFKLDVSGTTRITGGLTATTISATTYENLPSAFQSVRISGTTQFSANTGTFVNFSGVNISITSASTNTLVFSGSPQFTVPGLNNQVLTSNGSGGAVAETILTFDGGATSPTLNVNGVCVGRGNGNTPSNISIGNTSFCSLSFGGVNNVSIGYGSTLTKNTIGNQNIGIGRDVLSQNNTGCYNIGIGGSSLTSNINGCSNIGVGSSSLLGLANGSGNIGIGVSALQACCGGNFSSNIALGNLSQLCRTSGDNNISLGNNSQRYSTGTTRNISMGASSLLVNQGSDNVSLGYKTLFNNVNGNKNIAIGNYSLCGNVGGCCACGSGNSNIAIGYDSLRNNSSFSDHNIAIGQSALYYNTNAASNPKKPDFNIAIGRCSMLNNNDGYENIAIGRRALMSNAGAYSNRGCGNVALGRGTMANNFTGCYNIALGRSSLYNNTTGNYNIALGRNSGGEITTGYRNISLGYNSLYYTTTGHNNISIGNRSLYYNAEGNRNIAIGVNSIRKSTGSTDNIAIGTLTLNNWGGGKDPNIAIGTNALHGSTTNSGAPYYTTNYAKFTSNIAIGTGSQYCNYSGNDNVSLGKNTLNYNLNGNKNIAIGYYALSRANGGNYNIAIGTCSIGFAGPSPVGNFNIAIGYRSFGRTSCSGNHNILLGYQSMYATYGGSHNIGMGYRVLYSNCGGSNVAFGYRAMEQNVTGYNNIALGYKAMCSNTVGYRNVAIGYCVSSGNYSNSIILGGYATATGNCQFVVGSSTIPIGTITTETCTSSKTWEIRINGNTYKVLLV